MIREPFKLSLFLLGFNLCYFVESEKPSTKTTDRNISPKLPKGHHQRLGFHRPAQGHVKQLWYMPNATEFYQQYVALSQPVILRGAAKISRGYKLWTDSYLSDKYGNTKVNVDYGKKENRERSADVMTLREFLNIYNTTDSELYLVDSLPNPLQQEFVLPKCILCGGFTNRLQDSVLWFSNGGTKSFLHIDNVENINCLISGEKKWFLVDKENSKSIEIDHGEGDYCGVDVDNVDMFKYPSLQTIPWWIADISAGDCIYVPYGWAHQVRSYSRNLAVNIWWTPMTNFNETDCHVWSNMNHEMPLSEFTYTHGEQLRFMILNLIEKYNGKISFDTIHALIINEHDGEHLVTKKSFDLLDQNKDGILVVEEIQSQSAEIIEVALQRTAPGDVNLRGMYQKRDPRLEEMLNNLPQIHVEPYIEEFLLRIDKTQRDIQTFLEKHNDDLHPEIMAYLQEKVQEHYDDNIHEEL